MSTASAVWPGFIPSRALQPAALLLLSITMLSTSPSNLGGQAPESILHVACLNAFEGETATCVVTLLENRPGGLTLTPSYVGHGENPATADIDYVPNTEPLVFEGRAGEMKTLEIMTIEDLIRESDEAFRIEFNNNRFIAADSFAGVIIRNDDEMGITLTGGSAMEGGAITFTITLGVDYSEGVTVMPIYPGLGSTDDAEPSDWTPNSDSIVFEGNAGEVKTFTVQTTADDIVEENETFKVDLSPFTVGLPVRGTIMNDDSATVTLVAGSESRSETEGGTFQFTATLDSDVEGGLSLTPRFPQADGTDTADRNADYRLIGDRFDLAGMDASHVFSIEAVDDAVDEPDESFVVGVGIVGAPAVIAAAVDAAATETVTITDNDTSMVSISDASADEGDAMTFTVTLNTAVQGGLTVTPTWPDPGGADTAEAGMDYTRNTDPIAFLGRANETKTFTVDTTEDFIDEADETFTVGLMVSGAGVEVGMMDTATGTIVDDDTATVTIGDQTATEGGDLEFTVTLTAGVVGGLTVTPSFTDGTAMAGTDYTENTAPLTFAGNAGETQSFTVSTTDDAVDEPDESFTVGLAVSGTTVAVGMADTATGTITDNDDSMLSIGNEMAVEGEDLTFTVTLDVAVQGGLMVTPTYEDVTAMSGADYAPNEEVLVFAGTAGEMQSFTVSTTDDAVSEPDETFTVGLMASGAAVPVGMMATATGTITDNDDSMLSIGNEMAVEGENLVFTVTLDVAVQGGLTVTPTYTDGTATSGTDYTRYTSALTFVGNAGEAQSFTVATTDDAVSEPDETFTVGLMASGASVAVGMTDTATGTILDNDVSMVSIEDVSAVEGSGLRFTVTLDVAVAGGLTVVPTYPGGAGDTATAGTDYTRNVAALVFAGTAGETQSFTVNTADDVVDEPDETFTVGLTVSGASVAVGVGAAATGTIRDDEDSMLSIGDESAVEGGGLVFTVTLDVAVQGGLTVTPTYPGGGADTATSGTDYAPNTGALSFAGTAGETRTFTVSTTDDAVDEPDETFTVGLMASGASVPVGMTATATGTIMDNDSSMVSIANASAIEGAAVMFTVTLDAAVQGGLTVTPTYPDPRGADTATSGTDYTPNTGALSFTGTAGETQTFMVSTTDDAVDEPDETFTVGLMVGGADVPVGMTSTATGTIRDDDDSMLSITGGTVTEGAGVTFTVTLDAAVQGGFTATPTYPGGGGDTATSGTDYAPNTAALAFTGTAGETRTFTVMTTDDEVNEPTETFTVGLMVNDADVPVGMSATATGTITDNDDSMLSITGSSGAEGTGLVFTVTLDVAVQGGLTVTPTYPNPGNADTATSGTDYAPNTATLSFTGSTGETRTFMVSTTDDAVDEPDETFTVGLSVGGTSLEVGMDETATGTIRDNDVSMLSIEDATAIEGASLAFTVTLDTAVQGGLTVTPTYADVSAISGTDYARNTAALSFTGSAGETRTFMVSTTEDAVDEPAEAFTVGLTVSGAAVPVGATDTATGTIEDDDDSMLSIANATVVEGGDLVFTVTLDVAVQGGLTATPTYTDVSADSGADYVRNTAALSFAGTAGESMTFMVSTTDDVVDEPAETFAVGLAVSGTTLPIGMTSATGTITDNDVSMLSIGDVTATEGDGLAFTVTLDVAVQDGLTVTPTYADVTATSVDDYVRNVSPISFTGTAGETRMFTVSTIDDAVNEPAETFTVGLMASGTLVPVGMADAATGTITDNDDSMVSIGNASATEGGDVVFTVTLDVAVAGGLTVTPTYVDGTATSGTDYTPNTGALTFTGAAGEGQTFMVGTIDDAVGEPAETFTVGLMVSGAAVEVGMDATATGTIEDNDDSMISIEDASATEGGDIVFTVTLDVAVQGGLTVVPTYPGEADAATAGEDYVRNTDPLTFVGTAGETQTFSVATTDDEVDEPAETFTVGLMASGTSVPVGMTDAATGTIEDNDVSAVEIESASAVEGADLTFTLTLVSAVQGGLTVTPTYADGTATSDVDYAPNVLPIAFAGTEDETHAFTVSTTDDDLDEPAETFTVGLMTSDVSVPVNMDATATGTIEDNDDSMLSIEDASVDEGGVLSFSVTLNAAVQGGLTATPTYSDGTATAGSDYARNTDPIFFVGTAGETNVFEVRTIDDDRVEPDETFTVGLMLAGVEAPVGMNDTATGTILNDDVPPKSENAPVPVGSLPNLYLRAGGPSALVEVEGAFRDVDDERLFYAAASDAPAVARVRVAGSTVTVEPIAVGVATITVTASDPSGLSARQTFQVFVGTRPVVLPGAVSEVDLNAGESRAIRLADVFADPDGFDTLSFRARSDAPGFATAAVSDAVLTIEGIASGTAAVVVTATDERDLTASHRIVVRVNGLPTVLPGAPSEVEIAVGDGRTIPLSEVFADPDGFGTLTFSGGSDDASVAAATVSESTLRIEGVAAGVATVSLTAADHRGAEVGHDISVLVREVEIRGLLEIGLGAFGRAVLTSSTSAIGERIGSDVAGSAMSASDPLDSWAGAIVGGAGGERTHAGFLRGTLGGGTLLTPGRDGLRAELGNGGPTGRREASPPPFGSLLFGQGGDGGRGSWSVWSRWDRQNLDGAGYALDSDSIHFGADVKATTHLTFGLSVSRHDGDVALTLDGDGYAMENGLLTFLPYVRIAPDAKTDVWALGGIGRGDVSLGTGSTRETSDLSMSLFAGGVRRELARAGALRVNVRADYARTDLETDAGEGMSMGMTAGLSADASRLRGAVEAEVDLSGVVTPFASFGVRQDEGTDLSGTGFEIGGGLRLLAGPLSIEAHGRALVAHGEDDYSENGFGVRAELRAARDGTGPSLRLEPGWGADARFTDAAFSDRPLFARRSPTSVPSSDGLGLFERGGVRGRFGYGLRPGGGDWLATPFASYEDRPGFGSRRMLLGAELLGKELASGFRLEVAFGLERRAGFGDPPGGGNSGVLDIRATLRPGGNQDHRARRDDRRGGAVERREDRDD